jgi:hypothetical protein
MDALQAPGPPATVDPNLPADEGDGPSYALEDHRHGVDLHGANKGDLLVFTGSGWVAVPVGEDGTVLTADHVVTAGVSWTRVAVDAEFLAFIGL